MTERTVVSTQFDNKTCGLCGGGCYAWNGGAQCNFSCVIHGNRLSTYVCYACKSAGTIPTKLCNTTYLNDCTECDHTGKIQEVKNCIHDFSTMHYYCTVHGNNILEYHE